MLRIPLYQVDAFTNRPFAGNPAAVCPLQSWLDDATMQAIAMENNLAETAFFVPEGGPGQYRLRWFTPAIEIDLCGHATLASAHVLMTVLQPGLDRVAFQTRSGELTVVREGSRYTMDFPSRPPAPCEIHPRLVDGLGTQPQTVLAARDYLVVYRRAEDVMDLRPNLETLALVDRMVIVTAPGTAGIDFVSRFFAPQYGVPEDPVTGSAHCTLIPYWSQRLGRRTHLRARQVSARGGDLWCELAGDRVKIGGEAVLVIEGALVLPDSDAAR